MNSVLEEISKIGLVPVIKLDDPEKAVPLAKALKAGGIPVAEVTFRAAGADRAIANIAREMPDMLVGAGTVISVKQVKQAVAAGAKYIISPGFDPEVVSYCIENDIPITPGCSTASDVSVAAKMGLKVVKFFPAEDAGGVKMLKALSGPFGSMKFIPTGGINPKNLLDYINMPNVIACGGSWMVPGKMVAENDFDGITALAKEAVLTMLGASLCHIGINCQNKEEACGVAQSFNALLGGIHEASKSYFAGKDEIEAMNYNGAGTNGHIGIAVTNVERAMRYYSALGFTFDQDTITLDEAGKPKFVYLKEEIGGFAVHLKKK